MSFWLLEGSVEQTQKNTLIESNPRLTCNIRSAAEAANHCVTGPSWEFGNLGIQKTGNWVFENMGFWKFANLRFQEFGNLRILVFANLCVWKFGYSGRRELRYYQFRTQGNSEFANLGFVSLIICQFGNFEFREL